MISVSSLVQVIGMTVTILINNNASAFVMRTPVSSTTAALLKKSIHTPNIHHQQQKQQQHSSMALQMGLFDFVKGAFENNEYEDRRVTASHILVDSQDEANAVLASIQSKETTFGKAAQEYSSCPSGSKGGSLGTFEPGQMVKEFDDVVFDESVSPVGDVVGPVKTQFGWHLITVVERSVNQDRSEGSGVF